MVVYRQEKKYKVCVKKKWKVESVKSIQKTVNGEEESLMERAFFFFWCVREGEMGQDASEQRPAKTQKKIIPIVHLTNSY